MGGSGKETGSLRVVNRGAWLMQIERVCLALWIMNSGVFDLWWEARKIKGTEVRYRVGHVYILSIIC